ncbi:MAG: nucleoside-diphosphate kinase [Thermoplasmatales archaeon]|nr:nucleoside-diphosphate kinase [Thermoplasmatales archaeon]
MERTFLMIKPDGVQRRLIGKIFQRIEECGFKIVAMKFLKIDRRMAEKHYSIHKGKDFFEGLINYITSAPVVAMVVEGKNAIERVRKIVGSTNPKDAMAGTIRGDFAQDIGRNIIHASDSRETAEKEIKLWFSEDEIVEYVMDDEKWLFED